MCFYRQKLLILIIFLIIFLEAKNFTAVNYYIDDLSNSGDLWTPAAAGNDLNNGLTPLTPKATVSNLLSTYTLKTNDTVYIDTGIYTNFFKLTPYNTTNTNAYITLTGAGTNRTIFNATNFTYGIKMSNISWIRLSSLQIKNASIHNIYFDYVTNSIISNIKAGPSKANGLFLYNCNSCLVKNSYIYNCPGYGIFEYWSCRNNKYYDNIIKSCYTGLYLNCSTYDIFTRNTVFSNNFHGLNGTNIQYTYFTNNNIHHNKGDAIGLPGGDHNILYNNQCRNNLRDGITLFMQSYNYCDQNLVFSNWCINNSNGIQIHGNNNSIINNTITSNKLNGIFHNGTANLIAGNQINNNSTGIWILGCWNIIISNNRIHNSSTLGVGTLGEDNTRIINNKIYNNGTTGLAYWWTSGKWGCDGHVVKGNEIYHNQNDGLFIDGNNNYITSNTVYSNLDNGIYMKGDVFTNTYNILYGNQKNGIIAEDLNNTVIRNNTLFKNKQCGIKVLNPANVSVRNCISVSNSSGYSNFQYLTYSLAYGNSLNYSKTPGIGCLTNDACFQSVDPLNSDFLHLSGYQPSPCINTGDPADPVPANGGSSIDMGAYEFQIQNPSIVLTKKINKVMLNEQDSPSIPGSTIEYLIQYTNKDSTSEQCIVYDHIMNNYLLFISNSYTNGENSWQVEFSTNVSPLQTWISSDYTSIHPPVQKLKWIRWKRNTLGINNIGDLCFKAVIQ